MGHFIYFGLSFLSINKNQLTDMYWTPSVWHCCRCRNSLICKADWTPELPRSWHYTGGDQETKQFQVPVSAMNLPLNLSHNGKEGLGGQGRPFWRGCILHGSQMMQQWLQWDLGTEYDRQRQKYKGSEASMSEGQKGMESSEWGRGREMKLARHTGTHLFRFRCYSGCTGKWL